MLAASSTSAPKGGSKTYPSCHTQIRLSQCQPSHVDSAQKSFSPLSPELNNEPSPSLLLPVTAIYIFGFSPYVCSGHIERVVRGVELGDNCGGWPGAPRTPPRPAADTLECGHGRRTWTAAVFGLDHCQAFTFDQNPVFKKPDVGTGEALIRAGEQKPSHFPDSLW